MKAYFAILALLLLVLPTIQEKCPQGPPSKTTNFGGFDYEYPWPINYIELKTQNQQLCQAYMDIKPKHSAPYKKIPTVILLHGKNFCGVTWEPTIKVLLSKGYRVIVPDHIGFCKSSKPQNYQFSLQQLALNTQTLLQSLKIDSLTVIGHSLGGMLATRFALMYPKLVSNLVLVNPIGLEDWKAKGTPYASIDTIYLQERASNYTSIRGYEQATYYVGDWKPAYDVPVRMLLRLYQGPLAQRYAFIQALITDAVFTQPVVYEFPLLKDQRTLLIIGEKDTTAIGKQQAPPEIQKQLGIYSVLGKETAKAIGPNATLKEFPELGHTPQISDPDAFHDALLSWLQQS